MKNLVFSGAMTELRSVTTKESAPSSDAPPVNIGTSERHAEYRPSKQNRSANSEKRLLEAAETLFREKGYVHTRVSEIIRISGVSTGSFYHRFGDKNGLKDEMCARFVVASSERIAGLDLSRKTHGELRGMLRWLSGQIHETISANQGIYRIVDELSKTEPEKWESFRVLGERIRDRVVEYAAEYHDEITLPQARRDAALTNVVQLIITIILQTRLGAAGMFPKEPDALIDMLVQAAMGLLQPRD